MTTCLTLHMKFLTLFAMRCLLLPPLVRLLPFVINLEKTTVEECNSHVRIENMQQQLLSIMSASINHLAIIGQSKYPRQGQLVIPDLGTLFSSESNKSTSSKEISLKKQESVFYLSSDKRWSCTLTYSLGHSPFGHDADTTVTVTDTTTRSTTTFDISNIKSITFCLRYYFYSYSHMKLTFVLYKEN